MDEGLQVEVAMGHGWLGESWGIGSTGTSINSVAKSRSRFEELYGNKISKAEIRTFFEKVAKSDIQWQLAELSGNIIRPECPGLETLPAPAETSNL
ncbi:MAG: hypothetical protein F9K32_14495 [Desulfobulbaceae bacterium]|nr:MAG: hypothetical protein F9K32_14495 [Desulfobulbaceae bacterium]